MTLRAILTAPLIGLLFLMLLACVAAEEVAIFISSILPKGTPE